VFETSNNDYLLHHFDVLPNLHVSVAAATATQRHQTITSIIQMSPPTSTVASTTTAPADNNNNGASGKYM